MKNITKKILQYTITFVICAIVTILILVGRDSFYKSGQDLYMDLCDAFAVPGIIMLCFGALVFATAGGTFDMIAFGVVKLFQLFKRDLTKVKYRTFYDYRKAQQEKTRSYAYFLIIGIVFTLVALIFLLLYNR